jgi:hypothetical protein
MFFKSPKLKESLTLYKDYYKLVDEVTKLRKLNHHSEATKCLVKQINQDLILLSELFYLRAFTLNADDTLELNNLLVTGKPLEYLNPIALKCVEVEHTDPYSSDEYTLKLLPPRNPNTPIHTVLTAQSICFSPLELPIIGTPYCKRYPTFSYMPQLHCAFTLVIDKCLALVAEAQKTSSRKITKKAVATLITFADSTNILLEIPFWDSLTDITAILKVASEDLTTKKPSLETTLNMILNRSYTHKYYTTGIFHKHPKEDQFSITLL